MGKTRINRTIIILVVGITDAWKSRAESSGLSRIPLAFIVARMLPASMLARIAISDMVLTVQQGWRRVVRRDSRVAPVQGFTRVQSGCIGGPIS